MALMLQAATKHRTRNEPLMKKTLLILATIATTAAMAQNSNVVSAFMALEDNKLDEAAGLIEPTITNENTMVKEKTWRYRGMIYQRIAFSDDAALKAKYPDAMEKAIGSYTKAKELDTKNAEKEGNDKALRGLQAMALNNGNDAFTAKEYDKAVALYAQSEAVAKSFGEVDSNAVFNSALAYESKGDLGEALKRYQQCISIGYDKAEIYRYTASLQKRQNDLNGAIATTQAGRKKHPNDKELMLDEVSFLQEAGRVNEVETSVAEALQKDPGNCVLHSLQASIFEAKADPKGGTKPAEADMYKWYDAAEASYKKSIECDPKFFDGYFNIGVLYNNRAAFEYDKANNEKDNTKYEKLKAVADATFVKAIPYFEQAHELKPDDKPTIQQLKTLYAKTQNKVKFEEMKKLLGE